MWREYPGGLDGVIRAVRPKDGGYSVNFYLHPNTDNVEEWVSRHNMGIAEKFFEQVVGIQVYES